jgi:hypothetical protein
MSRPARNLSREDRRFFWKFVGGLYGLYAALMIVAVSVFVANHVSKNLALEPAAALRANEREIVR